MQTWQCETSLSVLWTQDQNVTERRL